MQVTVTFRHVNPTAGLRRHAEEKAERITKYLRRPLEAHVILSVEKQRHIAEIQVTGTHLNITATEETGDLYSAIDLAMGKIERQLEKHTAKYKQHKGRNNNAATSPLVQRREMPRTSIHTQRVTVKPMSVDEAVLQLKLRKNDFLLFTNAATDTLSVIYRRKDGNYGLIEPERS
jgi:putative sigma-54 modulation protein